MVHVVIVGAGPAGAGLACLLARRGVAVTLIERRLDSAREFRGEVLMPSGIAALEQIGLDDPVSRLPAYRQRRVDVYLNRRHLLSESLDPDAAALRVVAVSQPALLDALLDEAGAGAFTLIRGAAVRALRHEGGRVVGVRIRHDDGERDVPADLVIGADGRTSMVRRGLGVAVRSLGAPMDVVWCKLPCPEGWEGVRAYAGRGHLLVAYHTWDDTLQLGWVILKGTFGELRSRGIGQWVAEMAHHVTADVARHLEDHADAIERPFLLDVVADRAERWSTPGALLIGDAAHTMSPVGGQGINLALRDAIVAANHLLPVLGAGRLDHARLDAALLAIEAERLPEIREIQTLQAQPPRLLLSRSWWGEPVRRMAGALLGRPALRRRAAGRAAVFFDGVTRVHLAV